MVVLLLSLVPLPAVAHGEEPSHHVPWGALLSLGIGTLSLAGGLYLDESGDERAALADVAVLGGAGAIVLSAVLYWIL